MKKINVFSWLFITLFVMIDVNAQTIDIHSHSSMKRYYTCVPNAKTFLDLSKDNALPENLSKINWKKKNKKKRHQKDSNFKNYYQATFSDLREGNIKIAIHTLSPPEINMFHDFNWFPRFKNHIAAYWSTKLYKRIHTLKNTPPFEECLAELNFILKQDTVKYSQKVVFPKNRLEYEIYKKEQNTTIGILALEGSHVFFGNEALEYEWWNSENIESINLKSAFEDDVFLNIDSIKTYIKNPIFFIAPTHMMWNPVAGQAKSLDKAQNRRILNSLSQSLENRLSMFTKFGSGLAPKYTFGPPPTPIDDVCNCKCKDTKFQYANSCFDGVYESDNSFGLKVINQLLDTTKTHFPIYIDVKHMDIMARLDYYLLRDSLEKKLGFKIPIIYSHGGVSGKKLKAAYFTGLPPMYDWYEEIISPKDIYTELVQDTSEVEPYNCSLKFDYFKKYPSNPLFKDPSIQSPRLTSEDFKLSDNNTVGWFYPWGLNLFDEEIEEVYRSDGIIGVIADERPLGWKMINYENPTYIENLKSSLIKLNFIEPYLNKKLTKASLDSFRVAEPFLRNIFYIVQHSGRTDSTAWNHIAFGSDFDGMINPIDICPTATDIPQFRAYLERAIPVFLSIHQEYDKLLFCLTPKQALQKLFYDNSLRFIDTYWGVKNRLN